MVIRRDGGQTRVGLAGERELQRESEVLGSGGIAAGGEQRRVLLPVEIEAHGEQPAHGVVGREGELEGCIAAAGVAAHRGDVAGDGGLAAQREVEAQVEVVVEAVVVFLLAAGGGALLVLLAVGRLALRPFVLGGVPAEELHIVDLVAHADDPVVGA